MPREVLRLAGHAHRPQWSILGLLLANPVIGHELHDRSEVEVTVPATHFDVLMLDPLGAEKPVETASQLDWYHLVTSAVSRATIAMMPKVEIFFMEVLRAKNG